MDSPERAGQGPTPPSSVIEDSPVFNFISNLSPLEPVKSAYQAHNGPSHRGNLSTTILASPQFNTQRESRLSVSEKFLDFPGSSNRTSNDDEAKPCIASSNSLTSSACAVLEKDFHFEDHNPDDGSSSCQKSRLNLKLDVGRTVELAQSALNNLEKKSRLFSAEMDVKCNPDVGVPLEAEVDNFVQVKIEHMNSATLLEGNLDDCQIGDEELNKTQPDDAYSFLQQSSVLYNGIGHTSDLIPCNQSTMLLNEQMLKDFDGQNDSIPLYCKVAKQPQRVIRRRRLFSQLGSHEQSDMQSETIRNTVVSNGLSNKAFTEGCFEDQILSSFGIHDYMHPDAVSKDNSASYDPLAPQIQQGEISSSHMLVPSTTEQEIQISALATNMKANYSGHELQSSAVVDDYSLAILPASSQMLSQSSSPKQKRSKYYNRSEDVSCKRCSCKKSKCLKLYCECFASGMYCIKTNCFCQECLNNSIHEEIVAATRKSIMIRNPLAFEPKVIRPRDAGLPSNEDTCSTPASARHKTGCNCKKSGCLKKYCECFQGHAGCSSSCRCESCQNPFGCRDGEIYTKFKENEQSECDAEMGFADENCEPYPGLLEAISGTSPFEPNRDVTNTSVPSIAKPPRPSNSRAGKSSTRAGILDAAVLQDSHKLNQLSSESLSNGDIPDYLLGTQSPMNSIRTLSPKKNRVSSPNPANDRSLLLMSIPSFPSLYTDAYDAYDG